MGSTFLERFAKPCAVVARALFNALCFTSARQPVTPIPGLTSYIIFSRLASLPYRSFRVVWAGISPVFMLVLFAATNMVFPTDLFQKMRVTPCARTLRDPIWKLASQRSGALFFPQLVP